MELSNVSTWMSINILSANPKGPVIITGGGGAEEFHKATMQPP